MAKKKKIKKPRDWTVVHLINRGGSGAHEKKPNRSKDKQKLKDKIKQGNVEDI